MAKKVCVALTHEIVKIFNELILLNLLNYFLRIFQAWPISEPFNLVLVCSEREGMPKNIHVDFADAFGLERKSASTFFFPAICLVSKKYFENHSAHLSS